MSLTTYTVIVKTGTVGNSGTDANVYIQIHGSDASSEVIYLDDPDRDNFENGSVDDFELVMSDLGDIESIVLGHDNTGDGPGWYVDYVIIRNEDTEEEWEFTIDRWLAVDEEEGAVEIECVCD